MGNLPRLGTEGAELAAVALPVVPVSHAAPTQRPPGAGAPSPMDVGMKGSPAAGAGLVGARKGACIQAVLPLRPEPHPQRCCAGNGKRGLVFWVRAIPGRGTRAPVLCHLRRGGWGRGSLLGLAAGALLFVELEKQAAGPNNRSHSWSGVLSSVWVALLRQHLLPHVFLLAFPGKLT